MGKEILKCTKCGSYTLEKTHCDSSTTSSKPPKYSTRDTYGMYRRKYKRQKGI